MAIQALTPEQKQMLIDDFARRVVSDTPDGEINFELMAHSISLTLRKNGILNARIDPDEFARACARAREDRS
jgi:hypothetical protein